MFIYTYSYKADSSNESVGKLRAENLDEAVLLLSEIKQLCIDDILNLFNIKKVEQ
jgi:hypothetical protein